MDAIEQKAGCLPSDIRRGYFLMGEKFHGREARRWIEEMQKEGGKELSVIDMDAGSKLRGENTHLFRMMYTDSIYGDQPSLCSWLWACHCITSGVLPTRGMVKGGALRGGPTSVRLSDEKETVRVCIKDG